MKDLAPVRFRTVETDSYSKLHEDLPTPAYRRVVAIEADGVLEWANQPIAGMSQNEFSYDADQSVAVKIDLGPEHRDRLLAFYRRYLAYNQTKQRGEQYNCHRFALWMGGGVNSANSYYCPVAPTSIVGDGIKLD